MGVLLRNLIQVAIIQPAMLHIWYVSILWKLKVSSLRASRKIKGLQEGPLEGPPYPTTLDNQYIRLMDPRNT